MKRERRSPEVSRVLEALAQRLEKEFEAGGTLAHPREALERLGLSVTLRVDVSVEPSPSRVVVPSLGRVNPRWTEDDRDMLRALGIALDDVETDGSPHEPRGRQSS
jgi:hypothetical protein